MMFVDGKLAAWLIKELDMRGWSHRELAWRSDLSQTTVSDVISEKRPATWDFCADVARAVGIPAEELFILAGLKPAPPAPVPEEGRVLNTFRELTAAERDAALRMLHGLCTRPLPPTPQTEYSGNRTSRPTG